MTKTIVAILFGGRSPEHDVSILTGLQVFQALDKNLYSPLLIYLTPEGEWLTGEALKEKENYLLSDKIRNKLTRLTLDLNPHNGKGYFLPTKKNLFSQPISFDVVFPCFHGLIGEDGPIQGCFETAAVPYAGMRLAGSALAMDKVATKQLLKALEIPYLPYTLIPRPRSSLLLSSEMLRQMTRSLLFPACVKPSHLGSSIGVAKVDSPEELNAVLPMIFKYDWEALVEPYVSPLTEYNVAVRRQNNEGITSVIEEPQCKEALLDFKQKYLQGGGMKKTGTKSSLEGLVSLTRTLDPQIPEPLRERIKSYAVKTFEALGGTGAPRIDYLYNKETKELWLNEVNPCPGSLGYYLWDAAEPPVRFTSLVSFLIEEARFLQERKNLPPDPVPEMARLFKRPNSEKR